MSNDNAAAEELPEENVETSEQVEEVPAEDLKHAHDEALVEEWEEESFPGSDPPSNY